MNSILKGAAALALAGLSAGALAEDAAPAGPFAPENFSGNVALTSDYRFRGISNSDGWAIQGGMDWAYQGFFFGTWASNTEFSDANVEVDIYGGYGWSWMGLDLTLQGIYYMFPGESPTETEGLDPPGFDPSLGLKPGDAGTGFPAAPPGQVQPYAGEFPDIDANYFEVNFGVAKTFSEATWSPSIGFDYNFSPDFFGEDGDAHHFQISTGLTLPIGLSPYFNIGYQDVEGDEFSAFFATPKGYDWWWYSIGMSYDIVGFTLDVSYHWVDRGSACGAPNEPACAFNGGFDTFYNNYPYSAEGGTSYRDLTDDRVVFTISRSF